MLIMTVSLCQHHKKSKEAIRLKQTIAEQEDHMNDMGEEMGRVFDEWLEVSQKYQQCCLNDSIPF